MKKFSLSLVVALSGALIFSFFHYKNNDNNDNSRSYNYKTVINSKQVAGANGALEYKQLMYKDAVSGKINSQKLAQAKSEVLQKMMLKTTNLSFVEEGPDNVGGRTRGIAIHPDNDSIMFAGSVSGGLFVTYNGGSNWSRVQEFDDAMVSSASGTGSLGVSSIAITKGGILYVATGGSQFEGNIGAEYSGVITGDGLWYSMSTSNFNFQQVSGTDNDDILKVVSDPNSTNKVYFVGMGDALRYTEDYMPAQSVSGGWLANSTIGDLKISKDGNVMILGVHQGGMRTWISQDGGVNWTDLHTPVGGTSVLSGQSTIRVEYAISDFKNVDSNYVIYAAFANSAAKLGGVYRSADNGNSWCQIGPTSTGTFTPLSTSRSNQGNYNLVILASPDGESCILGGIDLWAWQHTPNSPACDNGQWYVWSAWYVDPSVPIYIHADNHRLVYNSQYLLLVGNDGGVQQRIGQIGTVINKGYNVTQFYSMGIGGTGSVIAGAQDNGTQYKDNSLPWSKEFAEVNDGDGFECEISYLNSSALVTTVYNGIIERSSDGGITSQDVPAPCSGIVGQTCGPFYNAIALMEDPEDLLSEDSVVYVPNEDKVVGDTITYFSESSGIPIQHILTQNLNVYDTMNIVGNDTFITVTGADTLSLPDYVQSYFVTQGDNSVYITRDMMRFTVNPEWWKLFDISGQSMHSFEISHDMNYAWCGSYSGSLVRVSGLKHAYSAEEADYDSKPQTSDTLIHTPTGDTITGSLISQINFEDDGSLYTYFSMSDSVLHGSPVEYELHVQTVNNFPGAISDISVDPNNPDNLCVVIGGTSSNHVYYSTNATSTSPTFTAIDGDLPDMPVFGCIIERDPSTDIIVIGTEYGVFTTDNISGSATTWAANNAEMGPIPVFDICQQWRDWEEGLSGGYRRVENPGAIYACTHGRGIWRADNLLSNPEPIEIANEVAKQFSNITVYPNPVKSNASVSFDLTKPSSISIEIYDLTGKMISTPYSNYKMNKGNYNLDLKINKITVGTYIVLLKTESEQKAIKFIKY